MSAERGKSLLEMPAAALGLHAQLERIIDARVEVALAKRFSPVSDHLPTPEELRMKSMTLNGAVWTPALLASEVGACPQTVERVERGQFKSQRPSTWALVDRMAAALGIPRDTYRMAVLRVRNAWLAGRRR
jgi:DNA-binding XRE family transcriptional regulator